MSDRMRAAITFRCNRELFHRACASAARRHMTLSAFLRHAVAERVRNDLSRPREPGDGWDAVGLGDEAARRQLLRDSDLQTQANPSGEEGDL